MTDLLGNIVSLIQEWQVTSPKVPTFVICDSSMVDDLELEILKRLAANRSNHGPVVFATDAIKVTTLEKLAVESKSGSTLSLTKPSLSFPLQVQLVKQAIHEKQNQLTYFRKSYSQPGFVHELTRLFTQLDNNSTASKNKSHINVESLKAIIKSNLTFKLNHTKSTYSSVIEEEITRTATLINLKWTNIMLIYKSYLQLKEKFVTKDKLLALLLSPATLPTPHNIIYVGNRYLTSLNEFNSLRVLLQGEPVSKKNHALNAHAFILNNNFTKRNHHYNLDISIFFNSQSIFTENIDLTTAKIPATVVKALDQELESRWVLSEIKRLVQEKDVRLKDIVIYYPSGDKIYPRLLKNVFSHSDFAYSLTTQTSLSNLPLPQFLEALFVTKEERFKTNNILQLLKSRLLLPNFGINEKTPSQAIIDKTKRLETLLPHLENFLLRRGLINEADWKYKWELFSTPTPVQVEINRDCNLIRKTVLNLFTKFDELKDDYFKEEFLNLCNEFNLLQTHQIQKQSLRRILLISESDETNLVEALSECQERFHQLLDYTSATKKELKSNLAGIFAEPFQTGKTKTIDQVKIVPLSEQQLPRYKYAFVLGLSDANLPAKVTAGPIFNLDEEVYLSQLFSSINDYQDRQALEKTQILRAFYSATNLYCSYSLNNLLANQEIAPSSFLDYVSGKTIEIDLNSKFNYSNFDLTPSLLNKDEQITLAINNTRWNKKKVTHLLNYQNKPQNLPTRLAEKLYDLNDTKKISLSFSAFETYYTNPYEYFLRYGLRLKKMEEHKLNSSHIGTYAHDLLEFATKKLTSESNLDELLQEAVEEIAANTSKHDGAHGGDIVSLLNSNSRNRLTKKWIENNVKNYLSYLKSWQASNEFQVALTEFHFENQQNFKKLALVLKNDFTIEVQGFIDRIDVFNPNNSETTFLNIIDYKTGSASGKLYQYDDKTNAGLNMQLLFYAWFVSENKAALSTLLRERGFHIRPNVEIGFVAYSGVNDKGIDDAYYQGIINESLPIEIKTNSIGIKSNKQIKISNFNSEIKENKELPLKIATAFEDILSGQLEITPYKLGNHNGLEYSDYRAIIAFDELVGNTYRDISESTKGE